MGSLDEIQRNLLMQDGLNIYPTLAAILTHFIKYFII